MAKQTDPIEQFIDRQLRSIWGSSINTLFRRHKEYAWWPHQHHKEDVVRSNRTEDLLIEAIDRKHARKTQRQEIVMDYVRQGYTIDEIATFMGRSPSMVSKDIRKWKDETGRGDIYGDCDD